MNNLFVAIVQTSIVWEDVDANLSVFTNKLKTIDTDVNLVVLPEMFASGFTMKGKEKIAERYDDVLAWMRNESSMGNYTLMGSTIYREEDKYYNRYLVAHPDGRVEFYDKRHLFTMGAESKHFTAGKDYIVVDVKGWKVRPFVCYDLRFPVWCRNTDNYDLAVFSANWPEARREAWMTLLKARAIENQAYVAGVNCVGEDGNKLIYSGDSAVYDYLGAKVAECETKQEEISICELSAERLNKFRKDFPVLTDMDKFEIQ